MSLWDAQKYGFGNVYWLTVAGIPVIWIEKATGLANPSGFGTQDASLVIDDSAEIGVEQIDRDRGTSVSLSLGFKLLDTAVTRDWLRRWSNQATLTATLSAAGAVATVDDTTGWPAAGELCLGLERIEYTNTTPTTFTGCSRAMAGSWANIHKPGTTAQIVTDRPRFWHGRDVTLWATPIDPAGFMPGASLTDDAVIVWRGRLDSGPERVTDGFTFSATSLDRVLDQPLATQVTGTIVDTTAKYVVNPDTSLVVTVQALAAGAAAAGWPAGGLVTLEMVPFAGLTVGTPTAGDALRDLISTAWDNAVTQAGVGAHFGSMKWYPQGTAAPGGGLVVQWTPRVALVADAGVDQIWHWVSIDGIGQDTLPDPNWLGASMPANSLALYISGDNPTQIGSATKIENALTSVTIHVDDGDPADIPANGLVLLSNGSTQWPFAYQWSATDGAELYLAGLNQGSYGSALKMTAQQAKGLTATVMLSTQGDFPTLMLTTLENSGTGLRGAYDTGPRGKGYGIDSSLILTSSFTGAQAPLASLTGTLTADGGSFADRCGGALGLFRRAVVCRPDTSATYDAPKLTLISTAPYGGGYSTTITDADLLSHSGDPIVSVHKAPSANAVTVLRKVGSAEDRLLLVDRDRVDAVGKIEISYEVPADSKDALFKVAQPAVISHLAADQTVQALEFAVPPWIQAEVGDVIWLTTTHPAVWTWTTSPGQIGYSGPARIVGRKLNLKTSRVTLVALIDAAVKVAALSPAAEVRGYDNAAAPTRIDVGLEYLPHFAAALADAGGNVKVLHYKVGSVESDGEGYSVSSASEVAGLCRLLVAISSGAPVLSTAARSTLTLPTTTGGDLTTYQGRFAHIADGTQWG